MTSQIILILEATPFHQIDILPQCASYIFCFSDQITLSLCLMMHQLNDLNFELKIFATSSDQARILMLHFFPNCDVVIVSCFIDDVIISADFSHTTIFKLLMTIFVVQLFT